MRHLCLLLSTALVCAACGNDKSPPARSSTAAAPQAPSELSASPETNTDSVPSPLDIECPANARIPAKPAAKRLVDDGRSMVGVELDLGTYPTAMCNDGTPAIFYVRPGKGKDANKWVVHLEGGGSCKDYDSCLNRRCGIGHETVRLMSSDWSATMMGPGGIFNPSPSYDGTAIENAFADYTKAYLHYCSSDGWTGQISDSVFSSDDGDKMRLHFRGRDIFTAVIAELKKGVSTAGGRVELPSVDDATHVLLTGISAGSNAVKVNADWFASQLTKTNPDVIVRAVGDASFGPRMIEAKDDYDSQMEAFHQMLQAGQKRAQDESCLAAHPSEPWRCADPLHVVHDHVTTPFFVHMDYIDPAALAKTDEVDAMGGKEPFSKAIRAELVAFVANQGEEHDNIAVSPGAFGTTCAQHVSLDQDAFFYGAFVDHDGKRFNFHDVLSNWLTGHQPSVVLAAAEAGSTKCPPAN